MKKKHSCFFKSSMMILTCSISDAVSMEVFRIGSVLSVILKPRRNSNRKMPVRWVEKWKVQEVLHFKKVASALQATCKSTLQRSLKMLTFKNRYAKITSRCFFCVCMAASAPPLLKALFEP